MGLNLRDRCAADCRHERNPNEIVVECGAFKPPMTNSDRIRAMSDEELAKFIATPCQCEVRPKRDGFRECGNDLCLQYLLKWLQQSTEEDT